MSGVPVVRLLATGGTIATTRDVATGVTAPTLSGGELARLGAENVTVDAREVVRKPSWALTIREMTRIALAARDAASEPGIAGVVVTHGTTTLEYTAFLTHLIWDVDEPVVFTGAMRRADEPEPDGPSNLRDAISVAASDVTRRWGAVVCFAGQVLAGSSTWKRNRSERDAFEDLNGPLATITNGEIKVRRSIMRPIRTLAGRAVEGVALVKAVPGASGAQLHAAMAQGAPGVVVEALPGSGGVPPGMHRSLRAAAEAVPVVIASRAPAGSVPDPPLGGTGGPLNGMHLISAGALTAEAAWVLLSLGLGESAGADGVRALFADLARPPSEERQHE